MDQCQLETPPVTLKSTFKVDHGASDTLSGSPEESSSECTDSLVKNPIGSELHVSSVTTGSEQSRPSSEVEVEIVVPAEEGSVGPRGAIRPSGRNNNNNNNQHSHRSAKRKYEDLSSSVSATDDNNAGIAGLEHAQHTTDNSSSSESTSIQQHQQSELDQQQAELDAARWKRLYAAASIDSDGLQVNN